MKGPKLTVIVPTLKRPDTLYWTLRTIINQDYDNFNVLVSDNFSNDNTHAVVNSFNDPRISYVNPGEKLSMSHHWEFALKNINDGYVTVLGDDDGLLPGGLKRAADIIRKTGTLALGWRFGNFNWEGLPPHFMIPMANYYRIVDARSEARKIFERSIYNTIEFPSLYGGFINVELINSLRNEFDGRFFHSRIPDFFSGALVAASVEKYVRAEFPISINATSKHSTGFATINEKNDQSTFLDLQKADGNIPFHSSLVFIRSNAIPIAEAMIRVHELRPDFPKVNLTRLLSEVAAEASTTESNVKYKELLEGIRKIGEMNGLENIAADIVANAVHKPLKSTIKKKFSPVSLSLYVDTTNSGISNVEDACRFSARVILRSYAEWRGEVSTNLARFAASSRYLFLKYLSPLKKFL